MQLQRRLERGLGTAQKGSERRAEEVGFNPEGSDMA